MTELERIPVTSPAAVSVFHRLLTQGPLARIDLARSTGLSQAAVTKASAALLEAGFITEQATDAERDGPGRPANPLAVVAGRSLIIGIKVTADATYGVLTDLTARILATVSVPNETAGVPDIVRGIIHVVAELRARAPRPEIAGVGVAVSGDIDADAGVVRDSPLLGWAGVELQRMLEVRLGIAVVIANDVRALTHAEYMFGIGRDAASFAVVTIGEGIGCGIFVNGAVVGGSHGVAGEIGHLPLAPGDLVCSCGRRGCVETIAASPAILRAVQQRTGARRSSESAGDEPAHADSRAAAAAHTDSDAGAAPDADTDAGTAAHADSATRPETFRDAIELARAGTPAAVEAFAAAGDTIGAALAALVNLVGPETVIIAGEGVDEYDLYADRIRTTFAEHAFSSAIDCDLVLRSHTFDDWARGAAVTVIARIAAGVSR